MRKPASSSPVMTAINTCTLDLFYLRTTFPLMAFVSPKGWSPHRKADRWHEHLRRGADVSSGQKQNAAARRVRCLYVTRMVAW